MQAATFIKLQQQDRSLLLITLSVVAAHFLLLIWAALTTAQAMPLNKPMERLIVKTIQLNENRQPPPIMLQKVEAAPAQATVESIPEPFSTPVPEPEPILERVPEPIPEPIPEPVPEPVLESKPMEQPKPKVEIKPEPKAAPKPKPKKEAKKAPIKKEPVKPKKQTPKKEVKKPEPKKTEKTLPKKEVKKETAKKEAKKETPKKPAKKEEAPQKPAAPKPDPQAEAVKAKQRELLAKAQESIAKIDRPRGMIASAGTASALSLASVPGKISALQIEALPSDQGSTLTPHERSYRDELAGRLKLLLKLPEHGEVKIKLTLERSGKVTKIAVVSSQSAANRSYIEKKVPTLTFPSFGDNFVGQSNYTFLVSLSNE